jgi:hypothetical protein
LIFCGFAVKAADPSAKEIEYRANKKFIHYLAAI